MGLGWSEEQQQPPHTESQSQPQPQTQPIDHTSPNHINGFFHSSLDKNPTESSQQLISDPNKPNAESLHKVAENINSNHKLPRDVDSHHDTKPSISEASALKLPHNCEVILRESTDSLPPTEGLSLHKLHDQLYNGVFLNNKRKKYWVEKNSNGNCFMLFARDLSITWADDNRFWHWPYLYETNDVYVDVAELLNVCWLEIHKKFDTRNLTPGVLYEVVFVMMLKDPAYGWEAPLNLRLTLPNGIKQERKENLMAKPRSQWIEVPVGEFRTSPENIGEIEIYVHEYEGKKWKRGLLVKGIAIQPKN